MLLLLLACVDDAADTKTPAAPSGCGTAVVTALGTPDCPAASTVQLTAQDGLAWPRDLAFAPETGLLWVADADFSGTVIVQDPGTDAQTAEVRTDYYAEHFMDTVSSLAFGVDDTFATCQESRDDWNDAPQDEDDFMGPTLWDADLDVYAVEGQTEDWQTQEGSHIDMLHQSPLCMGIAHDHDNVYWAFNGLDGTIVYYDFQDDHGPGGADHSDGVEGIYLELGLTRLGGIPGHMARDPDSNWLYISDTGANRVVRLDTSSGEQGEYRGRNFDGVDDLYAVRDATLEVVVDDLEAPSGLEILDGQLYVGENGTGVIHVFDLDGNALTTYETGAASLMGLARADDGAIWYVDAESAEVVRISP